MTLTANATDDFGIAKVTFYDGDTVVGTAIPPANYRDLHDPGGRRLRRADASRAVAEDSTGQTASDDGHDHGRRPEQLQPGRPAAPPVEPTVALTGVPATIDPSQGATVGADTTVDPTATVSKVEFKLGTRSVCTDTTAPYSCEILPNGDEVGSQAVQAIAHRLARPDGVRQQGHEGRPLPADEADPRRPSRQGQGEGKKGKKQLVRNITRSGGAT